MLSSRPRLAPRETSARPPRRLSVASWSPPGEHPCWLGDTRPRFLPRPRPSRARSQCGSPGCLGPASAPGTSRAGRCRLRSRSAAEGGDGDRGAARPELLSRRCAVPAPATRTLAKANLKAIASRDHWSSVWTVHRATMKHFLRMLIQVCLYFYCKFLWRCLKFVMRKLTGRCELQRICYNTKPGASRTMKIETSLRDSKSKLLQTSVSVHPDAIEKTIDDIMELKKINPDINPQLGISLQACLLQIVGYRNLTADVEKLRREPYDSDNPQHEEMLLKLWKFLKPNTPLESRISKQWCEIGFQGDDPKTDFRGMGLLGLYNLQYFAEQDATVAQQVLSDSLHPKCSKFSKAEWEKKRVDKAIGYSFAIVGINITDLAYNLLVSGALKTHFYNIAPEAPTLSHFQQTFCYLMHEFHKFWIEEDPMDIMEFNRVREKFRKRIIKQLQNPDMALCPHFAASEGLINM